LRKKIDNLFLYSLQNDNHKETQTLLSLPLRLSMTFPDGSKRSDGSFHLKRQVTYTLKFSEELNGQFDLVVVRKNYPYVPLSACPFDLPTMPKMKFRQIALTHDNVTHHGVTFDADNCAALSINFDETSSILSQMDRQLKLIYKRAKPIQLLLISHDPTTLLGKVKFQTLDFKMVCVTKCANYCQLEFKINFYLYLL
jgi:hypothetical protein